MLQRLSTLSPQELRRLAAMCGGAALLLFVALFVSQWQIGAAAVVCSTPGECRQDGAYASIWADEGVVRLGQGTTINWDSSSEVTAVEPSINCWGSNQGSGCGNPFQTFSQGSAYGGWHSFTIGSDRYFAAANDTQSSKIYKFTPTITGRTGIPGSGGQANYTMIDRSWKLDNSATVSSLGFYAYSAGTTVLKIIRHNGSSSYTVISSQNCVSSGSGWTDCTLSSPYAVPATGVFHVGAYSADNSSGMTENVARSYAGGNISSGTTQNFSEDTDRALALRATYQSPFAANCFGNGLACDTPWQDILTGTNKGHGGWKSFVSDAETYLVLGNSAGVSSKIYKFISTGVETSVEPNSYASYGNYTVFDRAWKLDNGKVIDKVGVYLAAAQSVTVKLAKRNSVGNYDIVVSTACSHPGGGWFDCDITNYTVPAAGDFYAGFYTATNNSASSNTLVQQAAYRGGNITGTNQGSFNEGNNSPAVRVTYTVNSACFGAGNSCGAPHQDLVGATAAQDVEVFTIGSDRYLAVAGSGIYKWMATIAGRSGPTPVPTSNMAGGYTWIDFSTKLDPGASVNKMGFYATSLGSGTELKILRDDGGNNFTVVRSVSCTSTVTGWNDCSLTAYGVPLTGNYYIGAFNGNGRIARSAGIVTRGYVGGDLAINASQNFNVGSDQVPVLRAWYQNAIPANCFGDGSIGCGTPWQIIGSSAASINAFTDAGINYIVETIYGGATKVYRLMSAPISQGEGTFIGNLTGRGGLGGAFDGVVDQGYGATAASTASPPGDGYVGKVFTTGKRIQKALVYGSNNLGYGHGGTPSVTLSLLAKNGAPTGPSDGTVLGTITFTESDNESASRTITSTNTTTSYTHVWVRLQSSAANDHFIGEVILHEAGGTQQCFGDSASCGVAYSNIPSNLASAGSELFSIDGMFYLAQGNSNDYSRLYRWFASADVESPSVAPYNNNGAGSTILERGWSLDNGKTVSSIGVHVGGATAQTVTVKILRRNGTGNYDIVRSQTCAHPGSGWYDCALSTSYVVPSEGYYYAGVYTPTLGVSYYFSSGGRAYMTGDASGSGQTFTEDNSYGTSVRVTYVGTKNCFGNGSVCGTYFQEFPGTDFYGGLSHYQLGSHHYLAAGATNPKTYRWVPAQNCFGDGITCNSPYQTLTGATYSTRGGFEQFSQGGVQYLVSGNQSFQLKGVTCFGNTITCGAPLQTLSTASALDAYTFTIPAGKFLVVTRDTTSSSMYKWNESNACWGNGGAGNCGSVYQTLATGSAAREWEVTEIGGNYYIGAATWNGSGANGTIYKWTASGAGCPSGGGFGNGTACNAGAYQTLINKLSTAIEFFKIGSDSFVAYSEYQGGVSSDGAGRLYIWTASGAGCPSGGGFGNGTACGTEVQKILQGSPSLDVHFYEIGGQYVLAFSDNEGSGNAVRQAVWDGSQFVSGGPSGIVGGVPRFVDTFLINSTRYLGFTHDGPMIRLHSWSGSVWQHFNDLPSTGGASDSFATFELESSPYLLVGGNGSAAALFKWVSGSSCYGDGAVCGTVMQTFTNTGSKGAAFSTTTEGKSYLTVADSGGSSYVYEYSSGTSKPACTLYDPEGAIISTQGSGTYETPAVTEDSTYTLTCNITGGGEETVAITLTADDTAQGGTFTYKNDDQVVGGQVAYGEAATLDWNITGADPNSCAVAMGNPYLSTSTVSAMGAGNTRSNVAIGPMALSGRHFASLECLRATLGTNNGLLLGGVTTGATGPSGLGEAYTFDGIDDYVNATGTLPTTLQGDSSFTVSFWAKASSYVVSRSAITLRQGTSLTSLLVYPFDTSGGNGTRVYYNGGTIINQNNGAIADNNWHHFLFVSRSATDQEMYVDGVSVGTNTASKTLSASLSDVTIGTYHPSSTQFFSGSIDDVRVYGRALSSSEITTLANKGPISAGLVGYWPFNDLQTFKTTAYDSSQSLYIRSLTVNAEVVPPDYNPSLSGAGVFDVNPKRVRRNSATTLTWNVEGLVPGDPRNSCEIISFPASAIVSPLSWDGQGTAWVNAVGTASGPITSRTTFTLRCTAPDGVTQTSTSVDATLLPTVQEI